MIFILWIDLDNRPNSHVPAAATLYVSFLNHNIHSTKGIWGKTIYFLHCFSLFVSLMVINIILISGFWFVYIIPLKRGRPRHMRPFSIIQSYTTKGVWGKTIQYYWCEISEFQKNIFLTIYIANIELFKALFVLRLHMGPIGGECTSEKWLFISLFEFLLTTDFYYWK